MSDKKNNSAWEGFRSLEFGPYYTLLLVRTDPKSDSPLEYKVESLLWREKRVRTTGSLETALEMFQEDVGRVIASWQVDLMS